MDHAYAGDEVTFTWEDEATGEKEKFPTLMRNTIKDLPNTLICYLQRFEVSDAKCSLLNVQNSICN